MRLHRFYIPQPLGEDVVVHDIHLLHQWVHVFRYQLGSTVILFNGSSAQYRYTFTSLHKQEAQLICSNKEEVFIPDSQTHLFLSLIKKDNFEIVTQKITELGATAITPIISTRSERKNISEERLHKIITESAEQCGRGDLLTIHPIRTLQEALDSLPKGTLSVVLTFSERPLAQVLTQHKDTPVALFVGPEGGWSEEDMAIFDQHHTLKASLGQTVLRAETAAICATFLASQRNL